MEMLNLPEDIQVEIIMKLPAKSISLCRCVCKNWDTILSNRKFVHNLLIQASKKPRLMVYRIPYSIIRASKDLIYSIDYSSISSDKCHRKNGAIEMDYPFEHGAYGVFGSCKGLFCFIARAKEGSWSLWIWNPTTREYKKGSLPQNDNNIRFGFGYDSQTDDYKIVKIAGYKNSPDCFKMQVYSLRSDSWNCIDNPIPYSFRAGTLRTRSRTPGGLLFNGALHWVGKSHKTSFDVIVSFDISTESFMDVPLPEELQSPLEGCGELDKHVGVLGDCLCLAVAVREIRLDVWVMQDYGVGESWTKQFTITQEQVPIPTGSFVKPIRSFENGEVLIETQESLVLYDQTNGRVRVVKSFDTAIGRTERDRRVVTVNSENYVESLVSLKSGTYVEKRTKTVKKKKASLVIILVS